MDSKIRTTTPRVLLVDDDPAFREAMGTGLRTAGLEVDVLADGHQLLARLQSIREGVPPPDVLVADASLPSCSGLACVERMRRLGLDIPTLVMSARDDPPTHARAAALGATVVPKPIGLAVLRAALTQALAS